MERVPAHILSQPYYSPQVPGRLIHFPPFGRLPRTHPHQRRNDAEEYVVNFVEEHRSFFEPLHPSFFELTTAMAFRYFADQKVDVAVIEVGMGGRLDCTNIIHPDLCVITNISFDHMQYLGNTLTKIAKEKAGIIKEGVPVVIGRAKGSVKRVFTMKAKEMNAPINYADSIFPYNPTDWLPYPECRR
jgi:dihydrofolate synthase/folylpolyglutamate synthase